MSNIAGECGININAYIPVATGHRTITYKCSGFCGGFGDRIKGIISAYLLALLTGRRFAIKMSSPLDITSVLMPNAYDWRLPDTIIQRSQLIVNRMTDASPSGIYLNMSIHNFADSWKPYDNILFESNLDDIIAVLSNPSFQPKLKTLGLKPSKVDHDKLVPLIYEILFDPSSDIKAMVNNALTIVRHSGSPLICLHIRLGKNPSIPKDDFIFDRSSSANEMINFVDKNLTRKGDQLPFIFVTSDSDEEVIKVRQHYFGRSLALEGPILHIDRVSNCSKKTLYSGYLKVVADFYMLGQCDTSILSYSGYSLQANLRRENPYQNLYLHCRTIHHIKHSDWTLPFERC
ncbi:unnamed protein product [Rotaria magnacalcarata]